MKQETSWKRVIIFPFLMSQMKAPLRDVAPAMQFRSPSKHTSRIYILLLKLRDVTEFVGKYGCGCVLVFVPGAQDKE